MANACVMCKRRLIGEVKLLIIEPHQYIEVVPDNKELLIWYFLIKGPEFSDFKGGYYIGKIMHSPEYPLKPPDFMMLTPNGRFNVGSKICLSNSSYHSDEWSALWNIHTILTGFLSIMLDDKEHGISHIHCTKAEREMHAKNSIEYNKKNHPAIIKLFSRFLDEDGNQKTEQTKTEPVTEIKEPVTEIPTPIEVPKPPEFVKEEIKESDKEEVKEPVTEIPIPIAVIEQVEIKEAFTQVKKLIEKNPKKKAVKLAKKETIQQKIIDPSTIPIDNYSNTLTEYQKIISEHKK